MRIVAALLTCLALSPTASLAGPPEIGAKKFYFQDPVFGVMVKCNNFSPVQSIAGADDPTVRYVDYHKIITIEGKPTCDSVGEFSADVEDVRSLGFVTIGEKYYRAWAVRIIEVQTSTSPITPVTSEPPRHSWVLYLEKAIEVAGS